MENLVRWLIEVKGLPPQKADVTGAMPDGSWSAFTNQDVNEGEVGGNLYKLQTCHIHPASMQPTTSHNAILPSLLIGLRDKE